MAYVTKKELLLAEQALMAVYDVRLVRAAAMLVYITNGWVSGYDQDERTDSYFIDDAGAEWVRRFAGPHGTVMVKVYEAQHGDGFKKHF